MVVVTNNELVINRCIEAANDAYPVFDTLYIDGNVEELLVKVRDMVYYGYPLITHPLAASIQMLRSKYRTVILGSDLCGLNPIHVEIAENSLYKYRQCTGHGSPDINNDEEYKWLDLQLFLSAQREGFKAWELV